MKMTVGDIHKTNSKVFIALPLGCVIIVSFVTEDFDYLDILQNAKLSDYMYNIMLINGDFTRDALVRHIFIKGWKIKL